MFRSKETKRISDPARFRGFGARLEPRYIFGAESLDQ